MFWMAIIVFVGIPAIVLVAGAYDYLVMTKQYEPVFSLTKRYQSKKINSIFNSSLPEPPSNIWLRRNKDQHYWN